MRSFENNHDRDTESSSRSSDSSSKNDAWQRLNREIEQSRSKNTSDQEKIPTGDKHFHITRNQDTNSPSKDTIKSFNELSEIGNTRDASTASSTEQTTDKHTSTIRWKHVLKTAFIMLLSAQGVSGNSTNSFEDDHGTALNHIDNLAC